MAVSDFQTIMLPMLRMMADGVEYTRAEMLGTPVAARYEIKKIDSDYFVEE